MVLVLLLFSTNIVVAFLDIQARTGKVRELYYQSWKSVTDYFVKSESVKKNTNKHWELLSEMRPKLKFANSAISVYASFFYLFNVYLFVVYYLPILFLFKLPEIDRPYLLLLFLFFYLYEVFLTLYLKKVFIFIDEKEN
jgi:hypothetical protein